MLGNFVCHVQWLAALNSTALVAKLYDLHVDPGRLARRSFAQFLLYLPNWFDLVPRKNAHCRPDNGRRELRRVAAGLPLLVASVALAAGVFQVDWRSSAFLLEHAAKVTAVYLVVAHAGVVGAASWRLVGSAACEPMAHPQCAATPAQFWRRWNQPAQQFFYTDVFLRLGGLRSPLRGTLLTFFVAGLIHEYVFGIAAGRVDGYQTAFFVLHGAVVAATMRLRPSGCWRLVGTAGTLAFVLVSSVLFFRSVENLVAFYACSPASL